MPRVKAVTGLLVAISFAVGFVWLTRPHDRLSTTGDRAAVLGAAPSALVPPPASAGRPGSDEIAIDSTHPFAFRRVIVDATADAPEACFRFSRLLDARAEAHYGDYVKIEPAVPAALRTANTDLCLGGLAYGTDYKVTIAAGLPARSGERTDRAETVDVTLGDRPARIAISGAGYIVPRETSNGLAVQTVNIDRVVIHVLRMSDRLLTTRLRSTNRYFDNAVLSQTVINKYELRGLLRDQAKVVWSGEMSIPPDHNRSVQTAFPLGNIIKPGDLGAYLVVAENGAKAMPAKFWSSAVGGENVGDDNDYYDWGERVAAHWAVVTDTALTAISGSDGLHVQVRSLATAEPLARVKLVLVAAGQDQLGEALTDSDGGARFAPGLLHGKGGGAAAMLVAYGARGDFALLDLTRAAFDLSDRGVSGRPAAGAIEAFLYTERGVYRPGETINVMALLRDHLGNALEGAPVALVLRRPDGVEAKRFSLAAAPQGGFHQEIALSRTAAFGVWSVEALVDPASAPVGRVQFNVQDFVPQMLKVTLTSAAGVLHPGASIEADIEGRFLYGAPAAGLNGEAELRIVRDPSPVPEAKDWSFGLIDEKVSDTVQSLELAPADDSGHTKIADVLKPLIATTAPLKAVLSAGLFEPSGRLVKDEIELAIRTQPVLIGLKPRFADNRTAEGQDAVVDIRVFDDTGHAVARTGLHWVLVRENRVYDWFEMGSGWRWHYHIVDEPVASGAIDVPEGAPAAISQPVDWGQYRLVVDDPRSQAASSIRFAAGWGETSDSADTPDKVAVTLERPSYAAGETARLHIAGPSAGKAQLIIARDRVFETRALDIAKEGTTVDIKTSAEWGSGAYAVVSLYRPLLGGGPHDPVRAVGLAWIALDTKPKTLAVAIAAPEKVMPRHPVEVVLKVDGAKAGEPTRVTLAAVDEGILQLTHFQSPDPVQFLFGKRRLGIDIRDDYGRLLDGSADAGAIHEGGDAAAAPIGGPGLEVRSTRTVALFSGPVDIGRDGSAHVTLDIPDFEGQLRLMAVAYGASAVGRGEGQLIVRDPVIADLSLPRFLAPGDSARLALLLHNTDGAPGTYHLNITADGAASVATDHPLDYSLAAGERKMDAVAITGFDEGIGTIRADVSGPGGYQVHREWQIAVRAPHYPIAIEDTQRQSPGQVFAFDARQLDAFVPGSVSISVGYSAFAGVDVASLLQSLYRYPYGCTEQLVSTTFPLLYFDDPILLGRAPKDESVKVRIARAIDTILDRQDAAGKIGLWRANDGQASVWLNVYALDFLLHARDAGYEVPDAALRRSFAWLSQVVQQLDQEHSGNFFEGPHATRAYAFYVMARYGHANLGQLRYAHDTIDGIRLENGGFQSASIHWRADHLGDSLAQSMSLGQLGGALSLVGDHARAHDAFEMAIANLGIRSFPGWWFHYSYYTEVQDTAALLAVAAESGEVGVAERARQHLVSLAPSSEQIDTQDKAWILAAVHALNRTDAARSLAVNGRPFMGIKLPTAFAPSVAEARQGFSVDNTSERDLWRTVVVRGAPRVAPSAIEAGYTVNKAYFQLDGTPLDPSHLRQNDRFVIEISGANKDHEEHKTVLADLLPAGWEIEGPVTQQPHAAAAEPRLYRRRHRATVNATIEPDAQTSGSRQQNFDFLGPLTKPLVVEARDDRFIAAFDLGRDRSGWRNPYFVNDEGEHLEDNEFRLAYIVRVVTPGTFTLPEAVVEDMYRPGMMARTEAGQTTAEPR